MSRYPSPPNPMPEARRQQVHGRLVGSESSAPDKFTWAMCGLLVVIFLAGMWEIWAIAASGVTALSPSGPSPSVSSAPPLQSTIAGEKP